MAEPYLPYQGPLVTRAEAKAARLARYFTGKPCPNGHISERITANGTCRVCSNRMSNASRAAKPEKYKALSQAWKAKNRAKITALERESRKANPEPFQRRWRRWQAANRQYFYDYYAAHRAQIKARIRKWVLDNPETVAAYKRNRRAMVAAAEGSHTGAEIRALFDKQQGRCVYCLVSIRRKYHVDHVMPLVLGGSNWISNLQLTCPACNQRKNRMEPAAFAARMGRLL